MRVLFAGTPEFSLPSLEYIYKNYDLVAVITQPDKPRGRGLKLIPSPVKEKAEKYNLPILQPDNLKDKEFLEKIKEFKPEFILEVSYGKIFPEEFLNLPAKGSINFHPSLLPGYKGPNPIRWVIINQENITGVSSHIISNKIDSGEILSQRRIDINRNETYGELYKKLSFLTVELIDESIENFNNKNYLKIDDPYKIKDFYARKQEKEEFKIDWNKSSKEIDALVRGLNPVPAAFTFYKKNILIKIYEVEILNEKFSDKKNGEIIFADNKKGLVIKTYDSAIKIITLKIQNKKKLNYKDFLNGFKITVGEILE